MMPRCLQNSTRNLVPCALRRLNLEQWAGDEWGSISTKFREPCHRYRASLNRSCT